MKNIHTNILGNLNDNQTGQKKLPEIHNALSIMFPFIHRVAIALYDDGIHEHTVKIKKQGYQASYTLPFYQAGNFLGFIFFNSFEKNCFTSNVLNILDVYGHLISTIKSMLAALRTANEMVHFKDPETGSHLERMSRFSRIIAKELSTLGKYNFDDKYIEDIFIYSPLHDVGKISIPDNIY